MKNIWFNLLVLVLFISCNTKNETATIYDFIPSKTSVLLNINDVESLKSNINNNSFLKSIANTSDYKAIAKKLKTLSLLNTVNPVLVSFLKTESDSLQYVITTTQVEDLLAIDSTSTIKTEPFNIGKLSAQKITSDTQITYAIFKDSIAIAASSKLLLKSVLAEKEKDPIIQKMISTIDKDKPLSVILNTKNNAVIETLFDSETLPFSTFTNYSLFDAEISQDQILLNGITKATDSSKSLINIFKNTTPQDNELAKVTPSNSDGFFSFTFDTYAKLKENLNRYNSKTTIDSTTTLFDNVIEVASIYEGRHRSVVLNSIDPISTKDALLSEQTIEETYRQITIFKFSEATLFTDTFFPLITFEEAKYYCNIDQFFVFANNVESLRNIIANYQNKTTLSTRDYYKDITKNLSDASSILQVLSPSALKNVLETNLDTSIEPSYAPYKTSAIQFVYDTEYAHVNAIIKKNKTKTRDNEVREVLNLTLDADLLNNPQFVTNHRTKQKEIIVQDVNNKLYLISNTGNILWKKQLDGPVLGKVSQIDIYKNGRLQLAFATPHRVYLIARNGKGVDGYPLKFNDNITQPLSVFDYDKNKKYRLFVTQGENVLLYDAKGKAVPGFEFKKAKETINSQPQHLRIKNKDYIIIKTEKQLHILTRRGKPRVTPKTKVNYSDQLVYEFENGFATTSKTGKLVQIKQNGTVTTSNLLGDNTNLVTTTKTLVAQNDNKLKIKNKTLELDFGNYSNPKLFYLRDKIYVSVTDFQSQKVLLFDSQGKSIPNFPVYGNSAIELNNIDSDRNLEFVTKGENNSILVYEIN